MPVIWTEFYGRDSSGDAKTFRWAAQHVSDPSDYYGGYKEARVLQFGTSESALSETDGALEAMYGAVVLADTDRLFRGWLGTVDQSQLANLEVVNRLVRDADRRELHKPVTIARAVVQKYEGLAGLQFRIDIQDTLSVQQDRVIDLPLVSQDFPDAPDDVLPRVVPVWYGDCTHTNGLVPVLPTGETYTAADTSTGWIGFVVACHACKEISDVFVDGAAVESGAYGVTVCAPNKPNWDTTFGSAVYRDVNGQRYTLIYVRGPYADANRLTVNLIGVETDNDGTGDALTDLIDQMGHFADNFLLPATSYSGTSWLSDGTWGDSTPKRDTDSFDACKTSLGTLLEDNTGAWGVTTQQRLADIWSMLNASADTCYGFTLDGQLKLVVNSPDTSATSVASFDHVNHIVDGTLAWEDHLELPMTYQRETAALLPRYLVTGELSYEYSARTTASNTGRAGPLTDASAVFSLQARLNSTAIEHVLKRRVARSRAGRRIVTFRTGLFAVHREIGDIIDVTTFDGPASSGWSARKLQVRKITVDIDLAAVDLECWDLEMDTDSGTWAVTYDLWATPPPTGSAGSIGTGGGSTGGGGSTTPSSDIVVFLGGSRTQAWTLASHAYQPVPDYVSFYATRSTGAVVRGACWARDSGIGVKMRLYCVTDSSSVGESSTVTSTTPTDVAFSAAVQVGKTYRLEVTADTDGKGCYGIGSLHLAA